MDTMISLFGDGHLKMIWHNDWWNIHRGIDEELFEERMSSLCCLQCLNINMVAESHPESEAEGVGKTRSQVILLVKELDQGIMAATGGRTWQRPTSRAGIRSVGWLHCNGEEP